MKAKRFCYLLFLLILFVFLNFLGNRELRQELRNTELIQTSSNGNYIDPEWIEFWGKDKQDEGHCIEIDSYGNIYVAGFTNSSSIKKQDILLIKYNSAGEELWNFTWGGNGEDVCNDIGIDSTDNIYLAGSTNSYGGGGMDSLLLKVNSSGDIEWYRTFGGSKYESYSSIAIDSSGDIWVVGMVTNTGTLGDETNINIDRYDHLGNRDPKTIWGMLGNDYCTSVALDSNEEIWIVGYNERIDEILLLKFNKQGSNQKFFHWGFYDDGIPTDIAIDSSDNMFLGGHFYNSPVKIHDFFLIKVNSTGYFHWSREWGETGVDKSYGVALDSNENVYFCGSTSSLGQGLEDVCLIKYSNKEGVQLFNATWGGNLNDSGLALKCDSSDNIYIAGFTHSYGAGLSDSFLLKSSPIFEINVNQPKENHFYGYDAPPFQIEVVSEFNNRWYTLNNGTPYYFSGVSGTINQTAWQLCEDGQIIIRFYANNSVGEIISGRVSILKDSFSPQIIINSPTPYEMFGNLTFNFDLTIIENNLNSTWYTLNDGTKNEFVGNMGTIDQGAWDTCNNGSVLIRFYANDTAGNVAFEEIIVRKNIYYPNITIISPTLYEEFSNVAPNFELLVIDPNLNTTWYTLNDGLKYFFLGTSGVINQSAWNSCESGTVSIKFYANNSVGNTAFKEVIILKSFPLTPKRAFAIIVGVSNYPGTSNDLMYCRSDAITMHTMLRSRYNFIPANMILLTDSEATRSAIFSAFTTIKNQISTEDIFFFYFSGHGGEASSSLHFICPYDSIPSNPSLFIYDLELDNLLDQLPCSEKFVMVDACNSGGFIPEVQAGNRFIMTACQANQLSWETSELRHGVFTFFFLDSIFVAPDSNGDGVRSMEEQFPYARSETIDYMLGWGELQQPSNYDGISGQTVLFPSIGSLSLVPNGNELHYSFYLYGHGILRCLNITVCSVYQNINLKIVDLRPFSLSSTGFGYYSGIIQLEEGFNVSGYEIHAEIEGYSLKTIVKTFGDTDNDGLYDILEIKNGMNPALNDSDSDGLSDYDEYYGITSPILYDTDGDGMPDGYEVNNGLNPLTDDTLLDLDGDGLNNIIEYNLGTYVNNPDTDNDGMYDGYEYENDLDLFINDANSDNDGDTLENILEYQLGSFANNDDTDGDGMDDGWEYNNGLDLFTDDTNLDPDNDGLDNLGEYQNDTDPNVEDTDGDTWNDGDEVDRGTDPLDPDDYPRPPAAISGYHLSLIIGFLALPVIIIISKNILNKHDKH